ncbi:hypothetical protein JTE90_014186, partial [Oedothorax gibbosus]
MSASYPEGKFGGKRLLRCSISLLRPLDRSDESICTVRTATDSTRVSSGLVLSGHILHHLSRSHVSRSKTPPLPQGGTRAVRCRPPAKGTWDPNAATPGCTSFRRRLIQEPLTRAKVGLLVVFQDGR